MQVRKALRFRLVHAITQWRSQPDAVATTPALGSSKVKSSNGETIQLRPTGAITGHTHTPSSSRSPDEARAKMGKNEELRLEKRMMQLCSLFPFLFAPTLHFCKLSHVHFSRCLWTKFACTPCGCRCWRDLQYRGGRERQVLWG